MRSSLVLAAIFCFASIVHATHGPVGNRCCWQWSAIRIPLEKIVSYTIQSEGVCPVTAVLFMTVQGKTICSDPNGAWAIKAMRKVDEKTKKEALQEQGPNEDGSTSSTTPAAPIEKLTTEAVSTEKLTTPAASTEKLTTEKRQKWTQTGVEEVQERVDVAEEVCEDSQDKSNSPQSTNINPPRVLMYCINNKQP